MRKKFTESNMVTPQPQNNINEDEWDIEASFATTKLVDSLSSMQEKNITLTVVILESINYKNDWIIDLGCSNHMIGDKEKL